MKTNKYIYILLLSIFTYSNSIFSQWIQQNSPTTSKLEALYFINSNVGFTSSSWINQLYKTEDGGITWNSVGNYSSSDICFVDDFNGYATSAPGSSGGTIKKTSNGGSSWSRITPPNSSAYLGVFATTPTTAYFINTEDKVLKTINSGNSLSSYTIPLDFSNGYNLTDIFFTNLDNGFISAQSGQVFKTTNGGNTWNEITNDDQGLYSIDFININIGYVAGNNGTIIKTNNGGTTWIDKSLGNNSHIRSIKFYDENNGIAVCLSGKIFQTNNGGDSWIEQNSGTTSHLYNIFYLNESSAIIVGDNGTILKNTNVLSNNEFENENKLDFSVYPTPTENILNVKSKTEITKIEIYSKLGQLILKNTKENKIDISNLTQGLYFVKVKDVNGNFGVKKIVKK